MHKLYVQSTHCIKKNLSVLHSNMVIAHYFGYIYSLLKSTRKTYLEINVKQFITTLTFFNKTITTNKYLNNNQSYKTL